MVVSVTKWKKPKPEKENTSGQYSLFEGTEKVDRAFAKTQAENAIREELKAALNQPPRPMREWRHGIVRSHLYLHFFNVIVDIELFLRTPLKIFAGKSIDDLLEDHWDIVRSWMKEMLLHKCECQYLIEGHESSPEQKM